MPRARDPARDKAYEIYKQHGGEIALTAIAELLEMPAATVRAWKTKDKWEQRLHGKPAATKKPVKKDRSAPKKRSEKSRAPNAPNEPSGRISDEDIQAEVEQLMANDQLTDMQRLFCAHYVSRFNLTEAAKAAGYAPKYANRIGWELKQKEPVKAEIERLKRAKIRLAMISEEDIIQKLLDIINTPITDYVEFGQEEVTVMGAFGPVMLENPANGEKVPMKEKINVMRLKDSAEIDGSLIQEVKVGAQGASIKAMDRFKALARLADYMDLMSTPQRKQYELARDRLELERERVEIERQKAGNDAEVEDLDDVDEEIYGQEKENDPV